MVGTAAKRLSHSAAGMQINGIPDAGTLLLDMISELLQDILRNHDPTPAAAATD